MSQESFEAIGTHWDIVITQELTSDKERGLFLALRTRIALFEATYSRFKDGSLVDQIAHRAGIYALPDDAQTMFDLYKRLYDTTEGAVTPLIGNTLVQAGYDKHYSLKVGTLHAPPLWDDALSYDFPTLTLSAPTQLDLGAIGKGYLVDIIGLLLEASGISSYSINAGGDIRQRSAGGVPLMVGLEHPEDKTLVIGSIAILNSSICGSSGSRRAWGGMHHIINPHTQRSPENIIAVWACAETTILADAMTTALFFADPKDLQKEFAFEYLLMYHDGSIAHSKGFTATLFTTS
jgi:FAD:protein FMN transferase